MEGLQVLQQYWWVWPVLIIDLVLKGMALYKSARLSEKGWFIALFVLNTAGILPAIYLLIKRGKKLFKYRSYHSLRSFQGDKNYVRHSWNPYMSG